MKVFCSNRITVQKSNSRVLLDPERLVENVEAIFISHAHYDHLPNTRKRPMKIPSVVCSEATERLFYERMGFHLTHRSDSFENNFLHIETLPGGHTFDSRVAKITDKETGKVMVYTGDVNLEDRGYLQGFKPIKCDILILEATYGDRNYRFPSFQEQMKNAREYVQTQLDERNPVALLGYPLGKAQLLNYCFGDLCDTRFSSDSIWKMEKLHMELGLKLFRTERLLKEELHKTSSVTPWMLFHNHTNVNNPLLNHLRKKHNLKIIGFSGWAKDQEEYKLRMGTDAGFIISDHSDYTNLLSIIKQSKPEKIFTVFGQAQALARELQKDGFNAVPLTQGQVTLESFF